jgi:hypothetical protein
MDDDFGKRGGSVGATIAFWLTLAELGLLVFGTIIHSQGNSDDSRQNLLALFGVLFMGFSCSMVVALPMAGLGYLLGKSAAKCRSVNTAFCQGALIIGAIVPGVLCTLPLLTEFKLVYSRSDLIYILSLFALLTASGSLLFGLVAIYVRDYRKFQRKRLIPQFTMLEFFIIFTIISIIISAMTSLTVL